MVNSRFLSVGALLATVGYVGAETAPGFPIQVTGEPLAVTFGSNEVSPPGEQIPRPDTVNPPNITTPVWTTADRGVLLMVDSDVPRNGSRVELLHWLVSDVTLGAAAGNESVLAIPSPGEAEYRQPSPPVGDVPHAYTFLLFAQPENFSIPEQFNAVLESRVFFNTSAFASAAGLTQPLAANYIRVQNLTGTPTTTFPPPRPTNNSTGTNGTTTPLPFPGGAPSAILGSGKVFWAGVAGSIVAGIAAFAL